MLNKSKITFVVPKGLQNDLRERVIKDDYGLRGKSKWVSEAIEMLLTMKDYPKLVSYSDEMTLLNQLETVVISYELKTKLDLAIIEIRKNYPILEGVKSRIARTAILQRLIRK